jgi:hypothetical protein
LLRTFGVSLAPNSRASSDACVSSDSSYGRKSLILVMAKNGSTVILWKTWNRWLFSCSWSQSAFESQKMSKSCNFFMALAAESVYPLRASRRWLYNGGFNRFSR